MFAATGNNIMSGVPQPKAIVEVIEFNGDGTLSVPAATRSVNGAVARSLPGGTGSYTVEAGLTGTITFDPCRTLRPSTRSSLPRPIRCG